jgi:integrase
MNKVNLRHLHVVCLGKAEYRYLRVPGAKRIALPRDMPLSSEAFLQAYTAALRNAELERIPDNQRPDKLPSVARALVAVFRASDAYAGLSENYRKLIERNLRAIEAANDRSVTTDTIRRDVENAGGPHQRVERLKAWRAICKEGARTGVIGADTSEGIKRAKLPKTDGHIPWTHDEIEVFRKRWPIGTRQRLAMELLYFTLARTNDAVTLAPRMIDRDGVLTFRQHKTKADAHVPWTCKLPKWAMHRKADRDALMACIAASGRPDAPTFWNGRSEKALSNVVSAAARDAGLTDRSAHGLRKAGCITLAEGGCTPQQGQAWSGHAALDEWNHYCQLRDKRRAVRG